MRFRRKNFYFSTWYRLLLHEKDDYTTTVSNIDARPSLEFYIEGNDIAKIEISCESESPLYYRYPLTYTYLSKLNSVANHCIMLHD
jgi:hypothetical protein